MGENFKLNFITNGEGIVDIDEPIGFDGAEFVVQQKDKLLGRDVSFSGGETEFTFHRMRNHYFDTLLYYYSTYGWESQVQLIIEKEGIESIIGELDFFEADTDQLEYFSCKVVQNLNQAIITKRNEISVDVFSDESVDLEPITPIDTENVLLKAMPVVQVSNWETPSAYQEDLNAKSKDSPDEATTKYYVFNPSISLKNFAIDDSLTFFENTQGTLGNYPELGSDFRIIRAQNNLRNIKIDISNLDYQLNTETSDGGDGYVDYSLELRYGLDFETAERHVFFSEDGVKENRSRTYSDDYSFKIDYLNRLDSVWLFFKYKVRMSRDFRPPGSNPTFTAKTTINSMDVKATATSVSYNTIVPSVRLYDATKQVVKSISELDIDFPIAEPNGELYDNRLFNGNLLRGLKDKPFNISMKDIEEWLPEIYGGYEVNNDVFFGIFKDFYTPNEIGVFESVRFDDYKKNLNKGFAINQFSYKYKKFASKKEKETENSFDIAHGEAQMSVLNKGVENKKEITVGFVRDSFEIDSQRRKALEISENTSTQDDSTIYILDTFKRTSDTSFTETDFMQHTYGDGKLKLTNTGTFNFILIGLRVGEVFLINGDDSNAGSYTISEVGDRYVVLSGSSSANNNGERVTSFTYIVSMVTAPYLSWSNEGFDYIDGIVDKDGFANLKYTVKRNTMRFYESYLATANIFTNKPIKITEYSNNRDLSLSYNELQTIEGEQFSPSNPILSPYTHDLTLVTDFNTFKSIENKLRTERGYIRTFDAKGHVIKVYIKEMSFANTDEIGELTINGAEEKYEESAINIIYQSGQGYIIINDEYRIRKITYEIELENVYLKDEQGRLLYNPIFWHKISVNGAKPTSKEQLEEWLTLIS